MKRYIHIFLMISGMLISSPVAMHPESLLTDLHLSLDVHEIKIKNIREAVWDDTGEFCFYRRMSGTEMRLPSSGEIHRKKNAYIRPSDAGLENEPFWHVAWSEQATAQHIIEIRGKEQDGANANDDMGTLSVNLDLGTFEFLNHYRNALLENSDYHVRLTIRCAPLISSLTHPDSGLSYAQNTVAIEWTRTQPLIGIIGYSYALDQLSDTEPDDVPEGTHLSKTFTRVSDGSWWFHVKALDKAGFWSDTGHFRITVQRSTYVADADELMHFRLYPNFPNPFNASTIIAYELAHPDEIRIDILTVTGAQILTLFQGVRSAGYHRHVWHSADVSSGVYLLRIQAGPHVKINRMTLIR